MNDYVSNFLKHPYRFRSDQKQQSSEENESDDEYLFLDIFSTLPAITKVKTSTEI